MTTSNPSAEAGIAAPVLADLPASRRMIDPDIALRLVLKSAVRFPPERVPLANACGLQLAEEVHADRDYPPFPRAMMDGYAVRTADAGRTVEVVGEVAAGQSVETKVVDGECLEIMTGAPCPAGTEAVVQKEHVRRNATRVDLPPNITAGGHIAPQGSECPTGKLVLGAGDTITPLATAVLASLGRTAVLVTRRPSLAVITTGSELIPPDQDPAPGQIRDSNGPMLAAMVRDMGIRRVPHLHVADCRRQIEQTLADVTDYDIVLFSGGVSVGNYDLVPEMLRTLGAELVFHKVTQKPGKPLLLAKKASQLLFGLPGNPLACHFCFQRYVASMIRLMEGKPPLPSALLGRLESPIQPKAGRTFFVPAKAQYDSETEADWNVHPLRGVSSADVFASCHANCYVEVPPGQTPVKAGTTLRFTWIGSAPWPN